MQYPVRRDVDPVDRIPPRCIAHPAFPLTQGIEGATPFFIAVVLGMICNERLLFGDNSEFNLKFCVELTILHSL
jgi:hypothetical protein